MNGLDGGKKTGELALPTTADVDSGLLLKPLNKFWENVALESFEQLPDDAEVHLKQRLKYLVVDDPYLRWRECTEPVGYPLQSAFRLERIMETPGEPNGSFDFLLKSAQTGKYVVMGGLFAGYCLQALAATPSEASIFRVEHVKAELHDGTEKDGARPDFTFNLVLVEHGKSQTNNGSKSQGGKWLNLRQDGYVDVVTAPLDKPPALKVHDAPSCS